MALPPSFKKKTAVAKKKGGKYGPPAPGGMKGVLADHFKNNRFGKKKFGKAKK